jgi:hypothetical protein
MNIKQNKSFINFLYFRTFICFPDKKTVSIKVSNGLKTNPPKGVTNHRKPSNSNCKRPTKTTYKL